MGKSIKKIFTVMLLLCVCLHEGVYAQEVFQNVDRKDILIGEKIRLTLILDATKDSANVSIPDSIPHFEIINKQVKDSITGALKLKITEIDFTSFDSGSFNFPSLLCNDGKDLQLATTDSFAVNVGYMQTDKEGQPRDIKTIIDEDYTNWFLIGLLALGFLILLILFFLYLKLRRKLSSKSTLIKINKTAYQNALKELQNLRSLNEQNKIEIKDLHTSLANVLKVYYSEVDRTNILTKTTNEVLDKLNAYKLKAEVTAQTKEALQTGDATKFAKYEPLKLENEEAINYIQKTIEEIETLRNKKN